MDRFELDGLDDLGDLAPRHLDAMAKVWKIGIGARAIADRMNIKCHKTASKYINLTIENGPIAAHKIICNNLSKGGYFTRNG